MHARVVTVQIQPGKIDEATRIYRDSVVPAAKQQQGFRGALLLTMPESSKGISVTLWETEANLKATETSGFFNEQIAKFGAVFAVPPTRELAEVAVQELAVRV